MRTRCLAAVVLVAALSLGAATHLDAGYRITLPSGASYELEKVGDTTFDVLDDSGATVGSIQVVNESCEVFDADGNLLGSAAVINPDALEILDDHLGSQE